MVNTFLSIPLSASAILHRIIDVVQLSSTCVLEQAKFLRQILRLRFRRLWNHPFFYTPPLLRLELVRWFRKRSSCRQLYKEKHAKADRLHVIMKLKSQQIRKARKPLHEIFLHWTWPSYSKGAITDTIKTLAASFIDTIVSVVISIVRNNRAMNVLYYRLSIFFDNSLVAISCYSIATPFAKKTLNWRRVSEDWSDIMLFWDCFNYVSKFSALYPCV